MALYTGNSGIVTLSASTTRTLIQLLSGSADRCRLVQWAISFNGTTAVEPIEVTLERQTSAGTASAFTELNYDPADGAPNGAITNTFTSTDPTASDILERYYVSPNGGLLVVQYPLGREPMLAVSTRMAIKTVTASGVTPKAIATMSWEE